jgi:hypothetical protein
MVIAAILRGLRGTMRGKSELRRIASNPPLPTGLIKMSVTPSGWRRRVAAWRGRRHLGLHPYIKVEESTSTEIASIEARVRKELYPSYSHLMKAYPVSS